MSVTLTFAPPPGPQDSIAKDLAAATTAIRVLMYELTNVALAQSLIDAHRRGVSVSVVLDSRMSREKECLAKELAAAGIPVALDPAHACMHHKTCLIDGTILWCGSYNWTYAAEHENAEAALRTDDPQTVARAAMEFGVHLAHSAAWTAP